MASPRTTTLPYQTRLLARNWLSRSAFELILEKPEGFSHRPGQKVTLAVGAEAREYSLVSSPEEEALGFCVRRVEGGMISTGWRR